MDKEVLVKSWFWATGFWIAITFLTVITTGGVYVEYVILSRLFWFLNLPAIEWYLAVIVAVAVVVWTICFLIWLAAEDQRIVG